MTQPWKALFTIARQAMSQPWRQSPASGDGHGWICPSRSVWIVGSSGIRALVPSGCTNGISSASCTNDFLRRALRLPDNYEDVIEYPKPLPDTVSEILEGTKRRDDSSE